LVLVLAVVLVGSVGVAATLTALDDGGSAAATRPVVTDDASAQLDALDGLTAVRETTIRRGSETTRTVERVSLDLASGSSRARQLSGPGDVDLRVSNGSTLWLYDRDANTVVLLETDGPAGGASSLDAIPRLLTRVQEPAATATGTRATPTPGVSPLPVVPSAPGSSQRVAGPAGASRGTYTVSLVGNETVDGRSAYVLKITQVTRAAGPVANYTQRLWLDSEWYYPLQRRTAWTQGGERTVVTTTYRNVTFEPGFGASTFTFDPPANATVERPETPDQRRYETVAALRAAANVSVPEPRVPEHFALARATRTSGRVTSVGLRYVNATGVLEVATLEPAYRTSSEGQRVTVAGQNATYRNLGPEQTVVWTCDGTQYKVSGQGLSRSFLLEMAGSVGCR
jgi:outer membrane lipoprotein-sorting protein